MTASMNITGVNLNGVPLATVVGDPTFVYDDAVTVSLSADDMDNMDYPHEGYYPDSGVVLANEYDFTTRTWNYHVRITTTTKRYGNSSVIMTLTDNQLSPR